jgi:hypothetical protein
MPRKLQQKCPKPTEFQLRADAVLTSEGDVLTTIPQPIAAPTSLIHCGTLLGRDAYVALHDDDRAADGDLLLGPPPAASKPPYKIVVGVRELQFDGLSVKLPKAIAAFAWQLAKEKNGVAYPTNRGSTCRTHVKRLQAKLLSLGIPKSVCEAGIVASTWSKPKPGAAASVQLPIKFVLANDGEHKRIRGVSYDDSREVNRYRRDKSSDSDDGD